MPRPGQRACGPALCKHTCKLPASQYWRTIQVSAMLAPVAESVLPRSWEVRVADPVRRAWVAMSDDTFAPLSPAKGRGRASKGIGAAPTSQARTMGRQRATQTGWLFLHQNWQGVEMQAQTNCLPTLDVQLASVASCQLCCRLHGSSSHLSAVWCGQNQNFSGLSSAAASDGKPSGVALRLPANLTAQTKICSAAAWHTHGHVVCQQTCCNCSKGSGPMLS